jgi:hypothetical protein
MGSWNKMKGGEFVLLKERKNNYRTNLGEIYSFSILHKLCED